MTTPREDPYLGFHYCTATRRWLMVSWNVEETFKGKGMPVPVTWLLA